MKIAQHTLVNGLWKSSKPTSALNPTIVLCFGNKQILQSQDWYGFVRNLYPEATIISGSTAGEISNEVILDNSLVATAIEFNSVTVLPVIVNIKDYDHSLAAARAVSSQLPSEGLRFVFILSDGSLVNGSDLVTGMNEAFQNKVPVAGGLAGDGADFTSTLTGINQNVVEGNIVAVGFYGENLKLGFGSQGGWAEFGPTRSITKSEKNVLYEIDGTNALDLYKNYLGEHADKLPGSALRFPLALTDGQGNTVVRTILGMDNIAKSMTFAGNMPEGSKVRLMKTTLDKLFDAASMAADLSDPESKIEGDKLSILVSCVGRKLVYGNRIDEEFEAVRQSLGSETLITGFYSYGEISPFSNFLECQLHNQTMTITTLGEGA